MTHYKKIILFIIGVMYVLPTHTMNGNTHKNNEKILDVCFYETPDNIELLKTMLTHQKIDPNIQDTDGDTPLHLAARRGKSAYVSILFIGKSKS